MDTGSIDVGDIEEGKYEEECGGYSSLVGFEPGLDLEFWKWV